MNRDVELGKAIARHNKASGRWMIPYRDFVREWANRLDFSRFDTGDDLLGDTMRHEALLLAIHGYGQAGGVMSFLSIPENEEEEDDEE